MTRREREILRVRRLVRDKHEFVADFTKGVWRYRGNHTLYCVRICQSLMFVWAEVSGLWYECRETALFEVEPTLLRDWRNSIRPDEGTTVIGYGLLEQLYYDPSTPPEIAGLLKVSP